MERSPDPTAAPPAAEETVHEQVQLQHCDEPMPADDVDEWAQDMLRQQPDNHVDQPDQPLGR